MSDKDRQVIQCPYCKKRFRTASTNGEKLPGRGLIEEIMGAEVLDLVVATDRSGKFRLAALLHRNGRYCAYYLGNQLPPPDDVMFSHGEPERFISDMESIASPIGRAWADAVRHREKL